MIVKAVSLHCNKDNHDKVYYIEILEVAPRKYTVAFQYGRRGKTLKYGTKTEEPVSLWEAEHLFDKKMQDELKKGYHVIPNPDDLMTLVTLMF